ncbi:FAD-dependent oxidoreductase [Achromobacter sp. 413638]|uniref:FAD-dependent oxidoreductase n=1 Tax=Achromobacter sp. 413638 TaxID=3342385 RepID=UPI00370C5A89
MDIAILGGGVAGLATALALARRGHEPRVYERRPAPATMGAGVTLWPNAGFVLADLELLDEVLALGGTPAAMHRYDAQGWSLGGLDIEPLDRLMGYPTCAILRTDLQAVLLRRAREAGVPVAFGREATAIANDPDGRAVVHFADGGHARPDLIIGADGRMSSVARAHVAGGNAPVYQGFVNWIGVAESSRDLVDGAAIHDYWGHGERVGIVALGRRKVYWAGAQAQTLEQARASAAAAQDGEWRKVRRLFESWPDPIGAVIDATPPRALRLIAVHDLEPLARWHRGNVLLVGDAAHAPLPTSGQGACQALEDAWHLARCLEDPAMGPGAELEQALERFGGLRREKTEAITRQARYFARELFITDPQACRERDARVRASDPLQGIQALAQGWGRGLPLSTLEQADAGMAVAAGMGAGR